MVRRHLPLLGLLVAIAGSTGCGNGGAPSTPDQGGGGVVTGSESETRLMGATFNSATSRRLWTSLTLPSSRTWVSHDEPAGPERTSLATAVEDSKRGVACVKITEPGRQTVWYAKDTAGRVIAIQWGDDPATLTTPTQLVDTWHYPTGNISTGQTWMADEAQWEVVSTSATAPRNGTAGCTLFRVNLTMGTPEDPSDDTSQYVWWSNASGVLETAASTTGAPGETYFYVQQPAN